MLLRTKVDEGPWCSGGGSGQVRVDLVELARVKPGPSVRGQAHVQGDSLLPSSLGQFSQNFLGVLPKWFEDCSKMMDHGYNNKPHQYNVQGIPERVNVKDDNSKKWR